jgi:hypothetical protein
VQRFLASLERFGVRLVVHERPASGRLHEASIAQNPEVLRHGPLGDAEHIRQRPDTEGPLRHQLENAQAHLDGESSQNT